MRTPWVPEFLFAGVPISIELSDLKVTMATTTAGTATRNSICVENRSNFVKGFAQLPFRAGSPLLCAYPKMSEVVKEAADVVLLQPATENPGLQADLSKERGCHVSSCRLRLPGPNSNAAALQVRAFVTRPSVAFLAHPGPLAPIWHLSQGRCGVRHEECA